MRKRIMFWAATALALAATGCFEVEQKYTLNPDGSGKMQVTVTAQQPQLNMGGPPPTPEARAKTLAKDLLTKSEGVTAWKDVSFKALEDGRSQFSGTAYFKDLNSMELANVNLLKLGWQQSGGQGVLTLRDETQAKKAEAGAADEAAGNTSAEKAQPAALTEEQIKAAIVKQRGETQQARMMMAPFVATLKAKAIVKLPGTLGEVSNFQKTLEPQTVSLEMTGEKLLAAMDKLVADDAFMRKTVLAGQSVTKGTNGPPEEANEILFGAKGPVRATATDLKPQFNYEAEVAAAKTAYPAMLARIGLADKVALPPKPGEGLTKVEVGGVRVVWPTAADQELRPFNWSAGYTLAMLGEFGGAVLSVGEGRVTKAVTDTGEDLLSSKAWDRKISFPHLSKDGESVAFEVQLALPSEKVKGLKEVSGVLVYSVASGSKPVDLGLAELKAGAAGKEYGATIESVGPSKWGEGQELVLKLSPNPEAVKEFKFLDESGAALGVERSGYSGSDTEMTYTFRRAKGGAFPAKGRIVVEVYQDVKQFEAPWKVENVTLLGRPMK